MDFTKNLLPHHYIVNEGKITKISRSENKLVYSNTCAFVQGNHNRRDAQMLI